MRSTWLLGAGVVVAVAGCTSSPAPASHRPTTATTRVGVAVTQTPTSQAPTTTKVTKAFKTAKTTSVAQAATTNKAATTTATATTATATTATRVTKQLVARPVHADGTAVAGYRVVPESDGGPAKCQDPSPVAVSRNIRFCGDSALDTVACWSSASPSHALCLRSPFNRTLVRIPYTGGFATLAAPAHPSPQALVLDDGARCLIRDGGAWDAVPGHPSWYGQYSCTGGQDVFGPIPDGIDRTAPLWTVHTVATTNTSRIQSHSVMSAYFVGTA